MTSFEDEINLTPLEFYMQECFELAKRVLGKTSPNPAVGAIVLDKNGLPVAKGTHKKAGLEHAEVLVLREAGESAKGGSLIVNLEPCCHTGKTPPCTDLIINSQIKQVVFSNYDPNPLVDHKGEKSLLESKVKVISKVLESQGLELNKFFFKWINTKLPWITLKQAQTLDGKVGLKDKGNVQISNELSQTEVHGLRNIYDAVMVGANTVLFDNPNLIVRNINQKSDNVEIRNPIRIILDPKLVTDPLSNVYKSNSKVILVTAAGHPKEKIKNYLSNNIKGNEYINVLEFKDVNEGRINLKSLFSYLGEHEILSILIEAGPKLAGEVVSQGLIDEYILFISTKLYGEEGIPSLFLKNRDEFLNKDLGFKLFNHKVIGNDLMLSYRLKNSLL